MFAVAMPIKPNTMNLALMKNIENLNSENPEEPQELSCATEKNRKDR